MTDVEPTPLSTDNRRVADLRRLTGRRRSRVESGRFVIEGPTPVAELLVAGAPIVEMFVDLDEWRSGTSSSELRSLTRLAVSASVPVHGLGGSVLASIADTDAPRGVLAVATRTVSSVATIAAEEGPLLVLVDVNDPGNAGTLVRTAEAAGVVGVVATGSTTDLFGPKAVRAASGSVVRLPIAEEHDVLATVRALRDAGRPVLATVVDGGVAPETVDLDGSFVLLVGSEAHGLPPAIVAACDGALTIPMATTVESVNVAIAGAAILFEAARQRRVGGVRT